MTTLYTFPQNQLMDNSFAQLDQLQKSINKLKVDLEDIHNLPIEVSQSNLSISDLGFAILAGVVGGAFSSSEKVSEFMRKAHDHSHNSETFVGKIFYHVGDHIDKPFDGKFVTRTGGAPEVPFHRVFFGHDILSTQSDNPFILMTKQYGVLKGPLQAVRHLLADTFSKQGLPLPGHAYLDFTKENGRTGNYLVELTKKLTVDARKVNRIKGSDVNVISHSEAFNHLFTIRMQDILSQGLTWGICTAYIKAAKIKDKIRQSQIKIIAYTVSLFVNFFIGMAKSGGVPYINWPTLTILIKEMVKFFKLNWLELRQLEKVTNQIVKENIQIEKMVFATGVDLPSYDSGSGYIKELKMQVEKFEDLVDFFEED